MRRGHISDFKIWLAVGGLIFSFVIFSEAKASTSASIIRHATQNYNPNSSATPPTSLPTGFAPIGVYPILVDIKPSSCVEVACKLISCTFDSDVKDVKEACKSDGDGAVDGDCVRDICSTNGCPFKSQVMDAVHSCRAPPAQQSGASRGCVDEVCGRIGCQYHSDLVEISKACLKADASCVKTTCRQSGCQFKSLALEALKSCQSVEF